MRKTVNNKEATIFRHTKELFTQYEINWAGRLLAAAARQFPDRIALIYKEDSITYNDWFIRSKQCAHLIKQRGVTPESRVLICLENSIDFYIAYYAVWYAGAVVAPLNIFLSNKELQHIVADANPSLIITNSNRIEQFQSLDISLPAVITQEDIANSVSLPSTDQGIDIPLKHMAALLYTSGTTGLPKGVMLSSQNILHNIAQSIARFGFTQHETIFGALPLFHVFTQMACVWASVFIGATVIIIPKIERRYLIEGLKQHPTIFLGVPALYGLLCMLKTAPVHCINHFISGGDALPDKIRSAFALIYGRRIVNGYGMTETSPVIATDFDDELTYTNTVGTLLYGIACSIRDKQHNPLPQGVIGELWIKSDSVMMGYYNAPEATNNVIHDGWFDTGDCAYIDTEKKLVITGREKDLIINKGFNIYPQEIENVILSSPHVLRAAVVGKPDPLEGETPVAFVQLMGPVKNIEKQLRALCMQQLAPYKIPHQFFCQTQELPLTSTGKVDKKILRETLKNN